MARALVPGSFDPITTGHLDIITRAAGMFETVLVAVAPNSSKTPLFTLAERVEMIQEACAHLPNVSVDAFQGLLVAYAVQHDASVIVKGLRAVSDFEYELQMAMMNRRLNSAVETVFLMTEAEHSYLSSSIVKEIARLGGAVEGLVPSHVETRLRQKVGNQNPELNPGLSADKNNNATPEVPRFVAPTHEGVDILKLLTELEDLVEGSPKMMGALLRFDEDKFHMTIMKIRANLPEEMKRASKLARDSERIVEETRDNADRVVSEARRAALQELERGRAEATHLKEDAREEARRQNAEAQTEANRLRQNADAEARQKLAEAQGNAAELIAEAQAQAAQMVSDDQIVQQALVQAQELKMRAEQEADAVRRGSDDYARDVLSNLENVLGKTMTQIQRGRDMLERK